VDHPLGFGGRPSYLEEYGKASRGSLVAERKGKRALTLHEGFGQETPAPVTEAKSAAESAS
jgi:hypothetical protein